MFFFFQQIYCEISDLSFEVAAAEWAAKGGWEAYASCQHQHVMVQNDMFIIYFRFEITTAAK